MGVDPSIHLYEVRPEKFKNFDDNQSNWQPLLLTPYQIIIIKRKFIFIWNNDSAITRALFCEFTKLRLVSKIQSINLLISLGSVPNQQHPSCLLFNARVRLIEIALFLHSKRMLLMKNRTTHSPYGQRFCWLRDEWKADDEIVCQFSVLHSQWKQPLTTGPNGRTGSIGAISFHSYSNLVVFW